MSFVEVTLSDFGEHYLMWLLGKALFLFSLMKKQLRKDKV